MAETSFGVTYDGPGLADGKMPVRDLAPALLALGELFAEASVAVYPEREPVALNIKATERGSFDVQLILESVWDQVLDVFSGDAVNALANLKELVIGPAGVGLFWLIKRLRGRKIVRHEPAPDPGHVRLVLDDETTVEIPTEAADLYSNIAVRKHAREVVEPLTRSDVDALRFHVERDVTIEVTRDDIPAYEPPADVAVPLGEHELAMVLSIASVAFTEGNKWRLSDGERTFYATIADEQFLERVELGLEAFRQGDMLRCRVHIVQSRLEAGLHTEYTVVEVLEHIPRTTQLRLDDV